MKYENSKYKICMTCIQIYCLHVWIFRLLWQLHVLLYLDNRTFCWMSLAYYLGQCLSKIKWTDRKGNRWIYTKRAKRHYITHQSSCSQSQILKRISLWHTRPAIFLLVLCGLKGKCLSYFTENWTHTLAAMFDDTWCWRNS